MAKSNSYMREPMVKCHDCGKEFPSELVEFVDIASDIFGRDEMTFKCPCCKTEQKSLVFI
jgi:Zn finger protein HypA/HybF involved in hydrogenase expression